VPFHGYDSCIVAAKGKWAEGGARDRSKQGGMRGGFALVAVPAEYGNSSIMTFMVRQDGIFFESPRSGHGQARGRDRII